MNKIEQMIKDLCPDGVKWVKLGAVCEIYDGTHQTPKYTDDGIPFISVENIKDIYGSKKYISVEAFNAYKIKPQIGDVFLTRIGTIGSCAVFYKQEDVAYYVSLALLRPGLSINSYFLKYIIESSIGETELRRITLVNAVPIKINKDDIKKANIPLPPLPIQQEIVRILDSFTSMITNLETELASRQKQYEYYRDKLFGEDLDALNNCIDCEVKTISELGTLTRGKRFVRTDIVDEGVPCIHYGDMYTFYGLYAKTAKTHITKEKAKSMRFAKKGDVVIVGAGENDWDIGVGLVWQGDEDAAIHDACYILEHEQNAMYISHYLRSTVYHLQLRMYVSSGKISSFSSKDLGRILIPIPSKERQQEIVSTLDTFESLISNIKQELDARRKQYEYYREKLLTFE